MMEPPFSPKKLAERWGCSRQNVHKLIRAGVLPHFKLGDKLLRIPAEAVQDKALVDFRVPRKPRLTFIDKFRREALLPEPESGYVYFIRCKAFVKIGYATSVPDRKRELGIGNPFDLEIIGAFKAHPSTENDLHRLLRRHRHRGEWFKLSGPVKQAIQELCDG